MSFDRAPNLESQPTTFRRSDDPEYRDDPEFQQFTTHISEKLFSLSSNVNQLSKQVNILGGRRETERVRERIQTLIEEAGAGFKEVGEGLKRISAWPDLGPAQKFTQSKLNAEFREYIGTFQVLQREAINKQKASRQALEDGESTRQIAGEGGDQQQLQEQQQARLADQSEVDFQSNLIVERETEIRQIEQSVGELNELFRDVASMVVEQGQQLEITSDNIIQVEQDTRGADSELRIASRHQKNARNKACCLLLILAIVLVVVVLAVVLG